MRVGRYVVYTPVSVVSGIMTGIGVIIILIQTLPLFGIPAGSGPLASIEAWPRIVNEGVQISGTHDIWMGGHKLLILLCYRIRNSQSSSWHHCPQPR
jgi:MFS superfamily sulfate permease-like transporter